MRTVAMLVALFAAVALGAAVIGAVAIDDDEPEVAAPTTSTTTTTYAPLARVTDLSMLERYCVTGNRGRPWPEVPPHVAGEPDRAWVPQPDGNPGQDVAPRFGPGSTVISPVADGSFTTDPTVFERTRSVVCIEHEATEPAGRTCDGYEAALGSFRPLPASSFQVGRSKFTVTVFELHSGGVLHRGEIWTELGGCPDRISVRSADTLLIRPLTEGDVSEWVSTHFVGGNPN